MLGDKTQVIVFYNLNYDLKRRGGFSIPNQLACRTNGIGRLGKTDNSQVGVFAVLMHDRACALVDGELFVPEQWFAADWPACRPTGTLLNGFTRMPRAPAAWPTTKPEAGRPGTTTWRWS